MSDEIDDAAARAAQKKMALETALERGKIQVRLDPRLNGVHVPEEFADESMLALNLSWRFPHTDMVINERGVAATLRFNSQPNRCVIPWSALFAIIPTEGEPLVWPLDVPPEFGGPPRDEFDEEQVTVEAVEPTRPRLSVVAGGIRSVPAAPLESKSEGRGRIEAIEPEDDQDDERPDPEPPTPVAQRAPWLKLVH